MGAQPLANTSSPWSKASGADPRSQNGQRVGDRRVASFAKTFLMVVACGVLLGGGLAYLLPYSPLPAPGTGPKRQTPPLAIAADSTADGGAAPVSRLPTPAGEKPLVKPAQPTPAVATTKQPSAQPRGHRPRVTPRISRPPAARTRVGTWLRQAREKILPHRREANDPKRRKKKAAPCKCAVNPRGFSPATLTASNAAVPGWHDPGGNWGSES
jgi:hypothetical protein